MTIIFQNPGLIDLRAVQIMGLNAKESKNPIGQFGTGLKYAIAVLLRSSCTISIWRGENEHKFAVNKSVFRGKEFDIVNMDGTPLGFTLELGKHWEPWMAIRELESNARDEGGQSFANADYQLSLQSTTIVVHGTTADTAYQQLGDIFISSKPLWSNSSLEVHRCQNPEQHSWIYYRGVRVQKLDHPALFRYNILSEQSLTEDRTLRYSWTAIGELQNLGSCDKDEVLLPLLSASKENFEWNCSFSEHMISDKFIEMTAAMGSRALPGAWKAARIARGFAEYEEVPMDALQCQMLARAHAFIERMGEHRIRRFPVHLAADLGVNRLGTTIRGRDEIWLAVRVFEMGMKQLISCLYEEFVHLDRNLTDLDYEMQNFLFDTIITQAAKLQGEIL